MVSYTDLQQGQSTETNQFLQSSAAAKSNDLGEITKDPTATNPESTAQKDPTSLTRVMDKRYNRKIRIRPTKPAPIIISTPPTEMRADVADMEIHVKKLVENLKSTSLDTVREATSELRLLAKEDTDNRVVIASCGALSPLIKLLRSSDTLTQEYAVTTLLNLSLNDNNKISIADAEAIEPLIHVLQTGSPGAKENSAATLYSLSVFEGNKIKIGNSGAIGPLVELLGSGTPRGKKDAATALFNLSTTTDNRIGIVKAGAVKHLIDLMDPATGMVDRAVVVLANLATIHEGQTAIAQAGGIPLLVEAIELGSERGKENATAALVHLCSHSNRHCRMVLEEGAVPPLVALSKSGTARAREKATLLLKQLRNLQHNHARRG